MPDVASLSAATQAPAPQLDEDAIYDLLYLARTGALTELKDDIQTPSLELRTTPAQIVQLVRDPYSKNTIAHYAAANGHIAILTYVQELEADERLAVAGTASDSDATPQSIFSSVNEQGSTPLHYAAVNGRMDAVELLLKHPEWSEDSERKRAYVEMRNHAGRTARDEADMQGAGREEWLKVVGLLEKYETDGQEAGSSAEAELDEAGASAAAEEDLERAREGVGGMSVEEGAERQA